MAAQDFIPSINWNCGTDDEEAIVGEMQRIVSTNVEAALQKFTSNLWTSFSVRDGVLCTFVGSEEIDGIEDKKFTRHIPVLDGVAEALEALCGYEEGVVVDKEGAEKLAAAFEAIGNEIRARAFKKP